MKINQGLPPASQYSRFGPLISKYVTEGKLRPDENGMYVINLAELGYNKLLGRGRLEYKVKVLVYEATEKAIDKVRRLGGEVILLSEGSKK